MIKILSLLFITTGLYAKVVIGFLEDSKNNSPIANADICDKYQCIQSKKDGSFKITTDALKLKVVARGYRPFAFKSNAQKKIHFLTPIKIKALYLTFWGCNQHSKTFKNTIKLLKQSSINAVVVDLKNEYGDILYKSDIKKAKEYGAFKNRQVYNIEDFIARFKAEDTYLIARIVLFKDELQASANPDYAIFKDGHIWRNGDGMAWVDPFDKRSWKYAVDIAEDAAKRGFDEINFDYIRFPAKDGIQLQKTNTIQNRLQTLDGFLAYAKKRLRPYGVFISVDIFGNICWSKDDMGIGQNIENFAKHADYIAPMLYPSCFESGTLGHCYPSEYPYEMVYKSIKHTHSKIDPSRIRPWLQGFRDYTKRKKHYGDYEIQQQIQAVMDAGADGWMLWSPTSKYRLSSLEVISSKKERKND
ncbi:COG1306 predicted glycoside hydrolase [hydrothermal vent metagenome]|uniref:COG1306 predicted glycoside hydrolase n=1 Tax=hydrothermal vent metagenome TaxID=652676 RepID=A0A1W1B8N3_9ZZZZ